MITYMITMASCRASLQVFQHYFHLNVIMITFMMFSGVPAILQCLAVLMEQANYNYGISIRILRLPRLPYSSLLWSLLGSCGY